MDYDPKYLQMLQREFAEQVDRLVSEHLLWNATVTEPVVTPTAECMAVVVQLNDGRAWLVYLDVATGDMQVTEQAAQKAPPF